MSKVLYLTANPKDVHESFSLSVGQRFIDTYKEQHPDDEIVIFDVYKENVPLIDDEVFAGWGKFANSQELSESEKQKVYRINEIVDQFISMDKFILVTPMWNLSVPPMMRAYVDCIMMAGKTFKYTEAGPEGLLKGKQAVHIQARGGFYSEGPAKDIEMGDRYIKAILNFIGITDVQSIIIEGHAFDPTKADTIKEKAIEEAIRVAKTF